MKYIDADRLKAEIEKPKNELKVGNYYLDNSEQAVGYENALIDLELLIDSLQQEQSEQKKKCNDCPHCIDRKDQYGWHFKGCFGGPYKGKFIAEIDECPLEQEQPEVDLEKEIRSMWEKCNPTDEGMGVESAYMHIEAFDIIARHFYELGKNSK